jgi:flavin reductase (DIM6/NTAB) family NADH-FMN oxidoreductase RutF
MTDRDPQLGKAIGRIPSGVYILAARHNGTAVACMLSWVQQASFEPLTVSVAMAKDRAAYGPICYGKAFTLSVLPQGDTSLMKKYARGIKPGEDPFAGVSVGQTPSGQPYLADALAWVECRLTQACDFGGDHDLLVAQVTAGQILRDGASFTHLRGSGYHY